MVTLIGMGSGTWDAGGKKDVPLGRSEMTCRLCCRFKYGAALRQGALGSQQAAVFHPCLGDFCAALYNPSSKGRPDYLQKAVRILRANGKGPETVCGLVRNIGREGQSARVLTLAELEDTPVDMFTTVYIGNGNTRALSGRMVTPRGYRK